MRDISSVFYWSYDTCIWLLVVMCQLIACSMSIFAHNVECCSSFICMNLYSSILSDMEGNTTCRFLINQCSCSEVVLYITLSYWLAVLASCFSFFVSCWLYGQHGRCDSLCALLAEMKSDSISIHSLVYRTTFSVKPLKWTHLFPETDSTFYYHNTLEPVS